MQSSKCVIIDNIIIIKNVFITFQTAKGLKSLKSTPSLLFIDGSSQIFTTIGQTSISPNF